MRELKNVGKYCYIWHPYNIYKGNVSRIVEELKKADVDGVALKIHDGAYFYEDLMPLVSAIRSANIAVGAWGYIYLKWLPLVEANTAIKAINFYKPDFYLIDAEAHAKYQFVGARIFATQLRAKLPDLVIGSNTYWYPPYHPELPWKSLRSICDFDCPQIYRYGTPSKTKIAKCKAEYSKMTPKLPMSMVAGDMYLEHGWKPTPQQVQEFIQTALEDAEIKVVCMWAMDQCETTPDLWAAFAGYDAPPQDTSALFSGAITAYFLNVRSGPSVKFKIWRTIKMGDRVTIWEIVDGWGSINKERTEWINLYYLKKV